MLTEKQAWKFLAELYEKGRLSGICDQVDNLYYECLISKKVHSNMCKKIKIEKKIRLERQWAVYIWHITDYRSRMKFCRLQYRKLK